jgi:hypothetical protein
MRRCHRQGRPGRRRWKVLLRWHLLEGMLRVSFARWPALKVNLWRLTGHGMWPERERERVHRLLSSSAEGVQRLMASNTERREQFEELCLLRSWVSSYDFPSSAHCK